MIYYKKKRNTTDLFLKKLHAQADLLLKRKRNIISEGWHEWELTFGLLALTQGRQDGCITQTRGAETVGERVSLIRMSCTGGCPSDSRGDTALNVTGKMNYMSYDVLLFGNPQFILIGITYFHPCSLSESTLANSSKYRQVLFSSRAVSRPVMSQHAIA